MRKCHVTDCPNRVHTPRLCREHTTEWYKSQECKQEIEAGFEKWLRRIAKDVGPFSQ